MEKLDQFLTRDYRNNHEIIGGEWSSRVVSLVFEGPSVFPREKRRCNSGLCCRYFVLIVIFMLRSIR